MTREFIEQLDVVEPNCFETDREERWYEVGLVKGLKIADENPISLWHDASEEPQENEYVLIQNDENDYDVTLTQSTDEWDTWCGTCKIIRWAYLKDLLQKGDAE